MKIDTVEKARALRRVESEFEGCFEETKTMLLDGTIVITNKARPLGSRGIESDEIVIFWEEDGECMKVFSVGDDLVKCPFYL